MTEETRDYLREMESHYTELRLAEQAFFKEAFRDIKSKYRRQIFWTMIIGFFIFVSWSFFSCPWLHKIGLCPMFH